MRAYVRSPLYNYISEPAEVYVCENGDMDNLVGTKTYLSKFGYEGTNVRTNNFYAVEYLCDPGKVSSFRHYVKINGYYVPARYTFNDTAVFFHSKRF